MFLRTVLKAPNSEFFENYFKIYMYPYYKILPPDLFTLIIIIIIIIIIGTPTHRVVSSFRRFLHSSRFMAAAYQPLTPSILASFPTSTLHMMRVLSTFLSTSGCVYRSLLGIRYLQFSQHGQPTRAY